MTMEYFNLLHLKKEPFSNSPEPEFLFSSPQHAQCLQMLELAVRLRRGLNLIIGDVGTGKTTLCRKLIQNLSAETAAGAPTIETQLLLDPATGDTLEFLRVVASLIGVQDLDEKDDARQLKEKIKTCLFRKGVDEEKIVVLIIDEGQKLQSDCLEILREFLNYETNHFKLLQIVIFAQQEIEKTLQAHRNLIDRVNFLYRLQPLTLRQTAGMIRHRIRVARESELISGELFTWPGILAVYWMTRGYPRRIVSLCHSVIVKMIVRGENKAGFFFVTGSAGNDGNSTNRAIRWASALILVLIAGIFAFVILDRGIAGYFEDNRVEISAKTTMPDEPASGATPHFVSDRAEYSSQALMPDLLGVVRFRKSMTLWSLLDTIYGDTTEETMRKVLAVNPRIYDRDRIEEGSEIVLPALAVGKNPAQSNYIVSLEGSRDIQSAYDAFWQLRASGRDGMRVLSLWTPKTGLRHEIVLKGGFQSLQSAQSAADGLRLNGATQARVLQDLDDHTIYFHRDAVLNAGYPGGQ